MRRIDVRWLFLFSLALFNCSPENPDDHVSANRAPTVWLSGEEPVASGDTYSVTLHWGGSDPDGHISHYEYLVKSGAGDMLDPAHLSGEWTTATESDVTLLFPNSAPEDGLASKGTTQTIFVRAVDNELLPSSEPDYISYTPRAILPAVRITAPPSFGLNPTSIPPISTFRWEAVKGRPAPAFVQWALVSTVEHDNSYAATVDYLRTDAAEHEWSEWVPFVYPGGPDRQSWTTPPQDYGNYVFAIRAKTGVHVNPVLQEPQNVRRLRVLSPLEAGPILVVHNSALLGHVIGVGCEFPLTTTNLAAGLPVTFTLAACAEHYGGTIEGYRYGWDILDLDDPDQWEMGITPFPGPTVTTQPRAFAFGTHVLSVEVRDNIGSCTRVQIKLNIVRFTGERNLLIVDDYRADEFPGAGWDVSNGGLPNDGEHDAFWLDMVSNVDGFDPARDVIDVTSNQPIPMTTLAPYKTIIWSVFGDIDARVISDQPSLYHFIRYRQNLMPGACSPTDGVLGDVVTNGMSQAVQVGVHVLIAGNHPVQNVVPRFYNLPLRWPMLPLYELEPGSSQFGAEPTYLAQRPGETGFAYQDLGLDAIDYAFLTNQRARLLGAGVGRYCPINGLRSIDTNSRRDDTMRATIPVDPDFSAVSLRPEAAGPGRIFNPGSQGLDVEVYNPAYFREGAACSYVTLRDGVFEPIYGLVCLDTAEPTYQQPVAFWAKAYENVIGEFPGAVAARSAVFGFAPVYFNPSEIKPDIEHILYDEWQLPRIVP